MKAVVATALGTPEVLQLKDVPAPIPQQGEVLINVEAIGVNFADTMMRRGFYPGQADPPFIPGLEVAGVVAEGPRRGERVMAVCQAAYAQQVVAKDAWTFRVPDEMPTVEAAGFLVTNLTAYFALYVSDVKPDERILIHAAAGGVGTAAVQLAHELGAEIFATASSAEKLERAKALGAEHLIDYKQNDFVAEVQRLTNGEGVDVVLEMVGGEVQQKSMGLLRNLGRMVIYGAASGKMAPIDPGLLFAHSNAVHGVYVYTLLQEPELLKTAMKDLMEYVRRKKLRTIIGQTFPLEQASAAQQLLETRGSSGKLILTVD